MSDFIDERHLASIEGRNVACSPIDSRVNRRAFLAGMGLGGAIFAISPHVRSIFESGAAELLACVGSFGAADGGTLHLVRDSARKTREC